MSIIRALADMEEKDESGSLCTIIDSHGSTPRHTGSKMLVYEDGSFLGTVGGGEIENRVRAEALEALKDGRTRVLHYNMVDPKVGDPGICGGQVEVLVEPFLPKPVVVVVGGGHVGKAVVHLAHWLGFRVIVSDDREVFSSPEANPDADFFHSGFLSELPSQIKITSQTFIILTTRGADVDIQGLPALLETKAGFIGVIGSRKRWLTTQRALQAAGIPEEKINRVISPIGLELQAETPEEIAVSIMAQIIMLRNSGTGKEMHQS